MGQTEDCRENDLALFEARQAVYGLLARWWAEPLDEVAWSVVSSSSWETVLAAFDNAALQEGESLADRYADVLCAVDRIGLERARAAFNWCFMGIGTKVAPWESVYVTGERLIMQPSTLAVREAYAEAGFAARNKGSEPDDHIATECDFMAKMAERAIGALAAGDEGVCADTLHASRVFLNDHLGRRASDFARAFEQAAAKARSCDGERAVDALAVYGALARFGEQFFGADGRLLEEFSCGE